jgi:hypothetical protein
MKVSSCRNSSFLDIHFDPTLERKQQAGHVGGSANKTRLAKL